MRYLYGREGDVEMTLNALLLSFAGCSGGGISRLRFSSGNYAYIVYDVMCNTSEADESQSSKTDFAGLMVLSSEEVVLKFQCTGFANEKYGIDSGLLPKSVSIEGFDYELP